MEMTCLKVEVYDFLLSPTLQTACKLFTPFCNVLKMLLNWN